MKRTGVSNIREETQADRLTVVQGKWFELLRAERVGEQRVVADLEVGVQREVVGGKADVGLEQDLQATLERAVDWSRTAAPEEPVVDDQQLGPLGGGEFEQLGVGGDSGGHGHNLGRSRNLQAVGTVVLKASGFEQTIDLLEDLGKQGGHHAKIAALEVWNTHERVGAWRSLVARTVRVGEVPGSNPGAPIG